MTDIIQRAKNLLEEATPGPWVAPDSGYIGSTSGVMIHDGQVLGDTTEDTELIAAAPELAQALAEETYEYAVQVKLGAKWLFLGRGVGGHNFARNAFWFVEKEKAQDYMVIGKDMSAPARLVRRRASPPEVING